jgi:hypothetical protein
MIAFQPEKRPQTLKTNISKITRYVNERITQFGFDVFINYSRRSMSRYLDVVINPHLRLHVRIADHPAGRWRRRAYDFDIHTNTPRVGSVDYIEFIEIVRKAYVEQ